jgi:DNA modification methylase
MLELINDDFRNYKFPEDAYVISDPPYNQRYHYKQYKDNEKLDDYAQLLVDAFKDKKAVIIHYPEETINVLGNVLGEVSQVVSWVYPSNTAKQSRLITWWNCKPDFHKYGQPYRQPNDPRNIKKVEAGRLARSYDWWEINQVKNVSKKDNPHPCPIPAELARRIIMMTTNEGDTVIDPFSGSGTIPLMASHLKRNGVGYEIDKTYHDYATIRTETQEWKNIL